MGMGSTSFAGPAVSHPTAYRRRRFLNWFPLGLSYALLYMGRYNLTVAKNSLGDLMTKEDFGLIFGAGTFVYAFAFLFNGPLVDRIGGRRGMLIGMAGTLVANLMMGLYLYSVLASGNPGGAPLRVVFSVLYALNMYFQSFGAVSIVKVNAHWFHVSERGSFSGIFGTMISSGIFLAFTVNEWFLSGARALLPGQPTQWIVFLAPAALLAVLFAVEFVLLRDKPSEAGLTDIDTGAASDGDGDEPLPTRVLLGRILSHPVILTVAAIEFCTGVLRNGVMHWFPIYAKEVWVLPKTHVLMQGSWENLGLVGAMFAVATVSGVLAARASGARRAMLVIFGSLAFLSPFVQGGWGGLLFIAGVVGGNVAGWVSDLFFQSRRGPASAGMYGLLAVLTGVMWFVLAKPQTTVSVADPKSGLAAGDRLLSIAGKEELRGWADVATAVACWPATCQASNWDAKSCSCSTSAPADPSITPSSGTIPARIERGGQTLDVQLPDPAATQRAGDRRALKVQPVLPMSPYLLGLVVFFMSVCVIGVHGLLSGTATMDFGGKRGAATAVGVIDGFVYLGTAVQSVSLGYLTSRDWAYWPLFLLPFAVLGFLFCLRIYRATATAPARPAANSGASKAA